MGIKKKQLLDVIKIYPQDIEHLKDVGTLYADGEHTDMLIKMKFIDDDIEDID